MRPDDLLALRLERQNLNIVPGSPPRLVKAGAGAAPPDPAFPAAGHHRRDLFRDPFRQEPIIRQPPPVTIRAARPASPDPGGSEPLRPPPVRARVVGRVAPGLRGARRVRCALHAGRRARGLHHARAQRGSQCPGGSARAARHPGLDLFQQAEVRALPARQRAALGKLRRCAACASPPSRATPRPSACASRRPARACGRSSSHRAADLVIVRDPPRPAAPTARMTSIELPWRLILSPHGAERWRHATAPVASPRPGTPSSGIRAWSRPTRTGTSSSRRMPDPNRTVRAIWALTGEGSPKAMQGRCPVAADLPPPTPAPSGCRSTTSIGSRSRICRRTSRSRTTRRNRSARTCMMLSALGGWLDSRGNWDPPGLSVEEWVHRATMGRDHYVRVVYKGFLFPVRPSRRAGQGQRAQVPQRREGRQRPADHRAE